MHMHPYAMGAIAVAAYARIAAYMRRIIVNTLTSALRFTHCSPCPMVASESIVSPRTPVAFDLPRRRALKRDHGPLRRLQDRIQSLRAQFTTQRCQSYSFGPVSALKRPGDMAIASIFGTRLLLNSPFSSAERLHSFPLSKLTWDQERLSVSVLHAPSHMRPPRVARMNVSRLERSPRLSLLLYWLALPFLSDLRSAGGLVAN